MVPGFHGEDISLLHPTRNSLEILFFRFLDNHETFASWLQAIRR